MKSEYKRAMDKVTADADFKESLLETLKAENKRPRRVIDFGSRTFMTVLASAAVLTLLVFSSVAVILPRIGHEQQNGQFDGASVQTVHPHVEVDPDKYVGVGSLNSVDPSEPHSMVSYAGADYGNSSDGDVNYSGTIHFAFMGFNEYGVGLMSNDLVLDTAIDEDYSINDLLSDYYRVITGSDGSYRSTDGMVDSFFDIPSSSLREIEVYADDVEVMNLDNVRLTDIGDDAYILVSIG